MSQELPESIERVFWGNRVRIVIRDGSPWFVAADVCLVLGYANARAAVAQHCKGVAKHDTLTSGGVQALTVIPERDVYRLVMRSSLPGAERFEEWIVGEVLPSIRKTGGYGREDALAALSDPATLRQLLGAYTERVLALEEAAKASLPKLEVYDRIIESGDTVGFREACKLVHAGTGAKEPEVRSFMLRRGWIQRLGGRLAAAHYGQARGYVTTRDREVSTTGGDRLVVPELRITQRGVARAIESLLATDLAHPLPPPNRDATGRLDPDGVGIAEVVDSLGRGYADRAHSSPVRPNSLLTSECLKPSPGNSST